MKPQIIKVCGMRDAENIRAIDELDVDWIGFIFYPSSPRYAGKFVPPLPAKAKRVGVFVNEETATLRETARRNSIDILQLHGDETPDDCRSLRGDGFKVIKAFSVSREDASFPAGLVKRYDNSCDYFLFDTYTAAYGGSGQSFQWEALHSYSGNTPFLLSGGISPTDLSRIREFHHPACVGIDLNSRFETRPGLKDIELLQHFIQEIRK